MRKVDVFGTPFSVTNYQAATQFIIARARQQQSTSVFALPVHGVITARDDAAFRAATLSADMIVPDGQPVRWVMNWLHSAGLPDRVYGPELTKHVLAAAHAEQLRVFLYGGATEEILEGFVDWIENTYPNVDLVGQYREPNFGKTTLQVEDLKQSQAHIVLCGLGCPAQELWIADHQDKVGAVMIGVGAAFSFYSGHLQQAPAWMQNAGLEWLYRLLREPRRLWRRYVITNTRFVCLVSRAWVRRLWGAQ